MADVVAELGSLMLGSRLKRLAERLQGSANILLIDAGVPLQSGQVAEVPGRAPGWASDVDGDVTRSCGAGTV